MRTRRGDADPFITKDGSEVRELMHPARHEGPANHSLAEAVVPPGVKTAVHRHPKSEEFYHVIRGRGVMLLGGERFDIAPGDTVCISPGVRHGLENPHSEELAVLCCCSPAYDHQDTLLED
ncbi:cupin domain-containing protein [Desulfohalovibrio reitneri]|uniref:cupin domain-containing protein n=1 Tax=Desulfohalovibrio reitneri TaxID=1307759 RepID=UPI0004A6C4A2|nr:cupin domain-containing protein [Desulfohalovibrio reitneri]